MTLEWRTGDFTETVRVRDPPDDPPPVREDDVNPLEKELEPELNFEKASPEFSLDDPDSEFSFTKWKNPLDFFSSELDGLEVLWNSYAAETRPEPDSCESSELEAPDPKK